jgi:hypothetical protein
MEMDRTIVENIAQVVDVLRSLGTTRKGSAPLLNAIRVGVLGDVETRSRWLCRCLMKRCFKSALFLIYVYSCIYISCITILFNFTMIFYYDLLNYLLIYLLIHLLIYLLSNINHLSLISGFVFDDFDLIIVSRYYFSSSPYVLASRI